MGLIGESRLRNVTGAGTALTTGHWQPFEMHEQPSSERVGYVPETGSLPVGRVCRNAHTCSQLLTQCAERRRLACKAMSFRERYPAESPFDI